MIITHYGGVYQISRRNLKKLLTDIRDGRAHSWELADYGARWIGRLGANLTDIEADAADCRLREIAW